MKSHIVLDCAGKRSATPLSEPGRRRREEPLNFNGMNESRHLDPYKPEKLCPRCALPAQSKTWRSLVALFCFILLPSTFSLSALGQNYSIDWYKIAGGGGTSTNGQYGLSGTIGQPDAGGAMTNGYYSLTGGFWSLYAVPTPGTPPLTLTYAGNTVTVSWAYPSTDWVLQQGSSLTGNWSDSTGVTNNGTINYLTLSRPTGIIFFRLIYVVQTTGAPTLTIILNPQPRAIIVSWPYPSTGWTLQTNNNLATGTWGNYLGAVVNNSVTNSPPTGTVFFRLKQ